MMGQAKPIASLSSSLLARKGQAKPAMRPQGFSGFGAVSDAIDDLGWNDMGHNATQPGPAPVNAAQVPPVLREREALATELGASAPFADKPTPPPITAQGAYVAREKQDTPRSDMAVRSKRRSNHSGDGTPVGGRGMKAAFTLRLDADRHLRLRLASALGGRSAQQLVTEALDSFLKTLPEVEAMAGRLSSGAVDDMDDRG